MSISLLKYRLYIAKYESSFSEKLAMGVFLFHCRSLPIVLSVNFQSIRKGWEKSWKYQLKSTGRPYQWKCPPKSVNFLIGQSTRVKTLLMKNVVIWTGASSTNTLLSMNAARATTRRQRNGSAARKFGDKDSSFT